MQNQSTSARKNVSQDETINELLLKNQALEKANAELLETVDRKKLLIDLRTDLYKHILEQANMALKAVTQTQKLNRYAVIYTELQFN